MKLISISPLGRNGNACRLWIESHRLAALGFAPGTPFTNSVAPDGGLHLKSAVLGTNHVSSRNISGGHRPIIDFSRQADLGWLAAHPEIKVTASHGIIHATPTRRAAAILRSRRVSAPLRVVEAFSGGGTLSAAIARTPGFTIAAGIEIEPRFADVWQSAHPDALLVQADLRSVDHADLPQFDILAAGIPCTSHSTMGRAKKSLAGKPELGDTGDLFIPVLSLVRERMPAAVVFENVPAFGSSLAGQLIVTHLERIGYHVTTTVLEPNAQWNELEDRKRWLLVATLDRPFEVPCPGIENRTPVGACLDAPDPARDTEDARRIATAIAGLVSHNARHKAMGHGFEFTVLDGTETRIPVIPKSYHKINTGPFVKTPAGLRMLRLPELERIRGHVTHAASYATGVEILGQGVQTRIFANIFQQLATHLGL